MTNYRTQVTDIAIGGHEGMTVYRTPEGIRKVAETDEAWAGLLNEFEHLRMMREDHAPRVYAANHDMFFPAGSIEAERIGNDRWTRQEDLGHALSIDPSPVLALGPERFFDECVDLLTSLRNNDIYHGDLTPPNLAWVEGRGLCALDWLESSRIGSDAPHKRDTSDAWQLFDTYMGILGYRHLTLAGGSRWKMARVIE